VLPIIRFFSFLQGKLSNICVDNDRFFFYRENSLLSVLPIIRIFFFSTGNCLISGVTIIRIISLSTGKTMSGASLVFESVGRGQIGNNQDLITTMKIKNDYKSTFYLP